MQRNIFAFIMALVVSDLVLAQQQPMSPPPVKETKKRKRDPALLDFRGVQKFDPELKKARERSGKPGVLQGDTPKDGVIWTVTIEGTKKVDADAIILQLKTRPGQEVSAELIAQDIKQIYKNGVFSDIIAKQTVNTDGSISVVFEVKEKPTIYQIQIKGNDALSEDDIKEVIDLKPYYVADVARVIENIEKIKKLYTDKGYYLVTVTYALEKTSKKSDVQSQKVDEADRNTSKLDFYEPDVVQGNFVNVIFHVDEKSKTKVQNIHFVGNTVLNSDMLRDVMRTKENHPLGILTQWGTYSEEMFEVDQYLLEQLYQEHGYLEVQIGKPQVAISSDKSGINITIPIVEGKQFFVGDFDVSGDFLVSTLEEAEQRKEENPTEPAFVKGQLKEYVHLKNGDIFNRTEIARGIQQITEQYRDEGYAYANITPITSTNEDTNAIDLRIDVEAGPRTTIERINIDGNLKTADEVIRREMRVYEGEYFSASMLKLSELRINQLGYFEQVKVTTKPGSSRETIVIDVELIEKRTGNFQAGGGYGSGGEGILLQAQISQNNLFGRGQSLTGTVQWSAFRRIFDVRFMEPYIAQVGGEPLFFSFSAYNTNRYVANFSRAATGGDLMLGYPIGKPLAKYSNRWFKEASTDLRAYVPDFENLRLFLGYTAERVEIVDDNINVMLLGLKARQPRYTTALRTVLQLDQRNNRLLPSRGYFLQLQAEFANPYLGSSLLALTENALHDRLKDSGLEAGLALLKSDAAANLFTRLSFNFRFYYNLDSWFFMDGVVAKFNIDVGYLNAFGKNLLFENYFLGGMNSIRGYYYRSIGPVANVSESKRTVGDAAQEFVIGGNKQILSNFELEFPIAAKIGLSAALFFDMGNAYAPNENFFYAGQSYPKGRNNLWLGMYASTGISLRFMLPIGLLRFEWGFPLTRRDPMTPGMINGDRPMLFEFNIGPSF